MVTTTADLTVIPNDEGCDILYRTDCGLAYSGYFSDYESRAFKELTLPMSVLSCAQAYALIHKDEAYEIFIRPTLRLNIDLFEIQGTVDGEYL